MTAPAKTSVSVLVCTRDRADLLQRCLTSLLACRPLPDQVVVVDQSRDARSRALVEALDEPCVEHVPDPRRGLSAAQNLGFAHARGDVVLVTDDDCIVPADWVETARTAFAGDATLGLLGGRVLPLGEAGPDRLPVSTRTSDEPRELSGSAAPWDVGSGNNFAVRRSVALSVGGNDERLGPGAPWRGGTDMDLFRRILRAGHAGRYEPALVVLHERATAAERLERRVPYGYGMGACLTLWRRQGDPLAAWLAKAWLHLRWARLAEGLRNRDRLRVREEVLVLAGTARGLVVALRGPAAPVTSI